VDGDSVGTNGTRLDFLAPVWHFREAHRLRISAPTADVLTAAREVTWGEARLARTLMRATKSPIIGDHRILDDFRSVGGGFAEETADELVFAGLSTLQAPLDATGRSAEYLRDFQEPGHTKSVLNLRHSAGVLTVESRLYCTDAATRRSFRPYWLLVRLPSGQVRMSLLRAIARRVASRVSR
jgi:hypothetical protein